MNTGRFPRAVLGTSALLFLALGLYFLVRPEGLSLVEVEAATAAARTELRATYGGFELGVGLFLAWCAKGDLVRVRTGLIAAALTLGGFGAGRLLGLVVDRPSQPIFLVLLAIEVGAVLLICAALHALKASAEAPAVSSAA